MAIFGRRRKKRRWTRRLVDDETHDFIDEVLQETAEVLRTPSGEFQLALLCDEAFDEGRTTDIEWLKSRGIDSESFYARELAPNWEGLTRDQRAQRIERFIDLSNQLGGADVGNEPPGPFLDMLASVHLKVLLLAWAFDRTYGYMDRLMNGPLMYRMAHARD
jgi:hypothetical protein